MANGMKLGVLMPLGDIGGDPATVREYAQAAQEQRLRFPRGARPCARRQRREPARLGRATPRTICSMTRSCCSAI